VGALCFATDIGEAAEWEKEIIFVLVEVNFFFLEKSKTSESAVEGLNGGMEVGRRRKAPASSRSPQYDGTYCTVVLCRSRGGTALPHHR
jgi:hypothetical protein